MSITTLVVDILELFSTADAIAVLPRLTASDRLSSPSSTRQQVCYAGSHVEAWDSCFP